MAELKLTPKLKNAFCRAIREGLTYKLACDRVGIAESTFYNWLKIARNEEEENPIFLEFLEAVKKANSFVASKRLKRINAAGEKGNWQADAWFLERRFPHEYGRNLQEHTGSVTVNKGYAKVSPDDWDD